MYRLLTVISLSSLFLGGCAQQVHVDFGRLAEQFRSFEIGKPRFDPDNPLLKKRLVLLSGKLTFSVAQTVCEQLVYLDEQSRTERITLLINSSGGDGTAYLAIAGMMKSVAAPVDTVNISFCASSAVTLFLSGTGKRYALQGSAFLIHDFRGAPPDLQKLYSRLGEDLLRSRCELPPDWLPLKEREFVLSAEQAKEYKLVDDVLAKMAL